jgi:hypothetical protein
MFEKMPLATQRYIFERTKLGKPIFCLLNHINFSQDYEYKTMALIVKNKALRKDIVKALLSDIRSSIKSKQIDFRFLNHQHHLAVFEVWQSMITSYSGKEIAPAFEFMGERSNNYAGKYMPTNYELASYSSRQRLQVVKYLLDQAKLTSHQNVSDLVQWVVKNKVLSVKETLPLINLIFTLDDDYLSHYRIPRLMHISDIAAKANRKLIANRCLELILKLLSDVSRYKVRGSAGCTRFGQLICFFDRVTKKQQFKIEKEVFKKGITNLDLWEIYGIIIDPRVRAKVFRMLETRKDPCLLSQLNKLPKKNK